MSNAPFSNWPWRAIGPAVFSLNDCILFADTDNVTEDVSEKNARLAAAAPELLSALKQLRADYESIVRSEFETMSGMPEWFALNVADADAAIAKAEGKP